MKKLIKIDLHVHSIKSYDATCSIRKLIRAAKKKGINGFVLTDHNYLDLGLDNIYDGVRVIKGEEIKTREGEIIGLFLKQKIDSGMTADETIIEIKRQNAIVYLPHPFDRRRKNVLKETKILELAHLIDIVEVFNSRCSDMLPNIKAMAYAKKYNLRLGAGSDAHTCVELGNAYIEIEDFNSPDDFLLKINEAKIKGRLTPIWYLSFFNSCLRKIVNKSYKLLK